MILLHFIEEDNEEFIVETCKGEKRPALPVKCSFFDPFTDSEELGETHVSYYCIFMVLHTSVYRYVCVCAQQNE